MDRHTDAGTDARMDNVKTVYPPLTMFAGGIIKKSHFWHKNVKILGSFTHIIIDITTLSY